MAKTNFTKMEGNLSEALHKIKVEELLRSAEELSNNPESLELKEKINTVRQLKLELKRLYRQDKETYKKLGIKRKKLEEQLANYTALTKEEWATLLQIKEKVEQLIKQLPIEESSNEKLVEDERHKHINKRFNVNERWLPLK